VISKQKMTQNTNHYLWFVDYVTKYVCDFEMRPLILVQRNFRVPTDKLRNFNYYRPAGHQERKKKHSRMDYCST